VKLGELGAWFGRRNKSPRAMVGAMSRCKSFSTLITNLECSSDVIGHLSSCSQCWVINVDNSFSLLALATSLLATKEGIHGWRVPALFPGLCSFLHW